MGTCFSHQKKKKFSVSLCGDDLLEMRFFVILCGDVLLDVLQFGNRRQLVKLERVGRRLHWMVENFYGSRPFLRLGLDLSAKKCKAFIVGNSTTKVSLPTSVPRFLRFNEVQLSYYEGHESIEEKCRSIESYLQPLKEALNDSISIQFYGDINRNDLTKFSDHSKLLDYLSEHLLKICNSSRGYEFYISFYTEEEAGAEANVIISIMQMPQICRCSTLRLKLYCFPQHVLLPVEAISSWLNRSIDGEMNFIGRTPKEIFLRIYVDRIQNIVEMCDHLVEEFQTANEPTLPYTFHLGFVVTDDVFTNIKNTRTNEEFSIRANAFGEIEIKRMKKKKN